MIKQDATQFNDLIRPFTDLISLSVEARTGTQIFLIVMWLCQINIWITRPFIWADKSWETTHYFTGSPRKTSGKGHEFFSRNFEWTF